MGKLHYQDPPSPKQRKSFAPFLAEDEELVLVTGWGKTYLRSRVSYWIMIPGAIFIIAGLGVAWWYEYNLGYGLLGGMGVALIFALFKAFWTHHANRYILTTRRVIVKKGLITVKITSALYDKITHIEVDQKFFDRILLHHGTVIINTAGMNKESIVLQYVEYPIEFKNLLERLINREREQYNSRAERLVEVEGEVIE
jgi:uncharacterized membrane protein YdbT with pleckstrin-like domain